jgi:hypothetical protein
MSNWHHAPAHHLSDGDTFFITGGTYLKHEFYRDAVAWLARLRYTNENAVHHGIVQDARKYRWCSAAAFEETAPRKFVEAVSRVRIDAVKVYDPF